MRFKSCEEGNLCSLISALFIFKRNGSPFGSKCQFFNGEYIIPFSLLYFIVWNLSPAPA